MSSEVISLWARASDTLLCQLDRKFQMMKMGNFGIEICLDEKEIYFINKISTWSEMLQLTTPQSNYAYN